MSIQKEHGFLKKPKKKNQYEMKQISQKKMNLYFVGGLFGLLTLSTLTIFIAFNRTVNTGSQNETVSVVEVNKEEVDYRLQLFLDGYVSAYFNFSSDTTKQAAELEKLLEYYNFMPEIKGDGQVKQPSQLLSSRLVQVLDNVATYKVTYETGTEKQKITVLFGVPFGGAEGQYYVSGLPYFQAVENFKATEVDENSKLSLGAIDDISEEERSSLESFLKLFFKNYTTSQDNLDIVAKGVRSINGAKFVSLDFTYFKRDGSAKLIAYVQATFDIAGTTHSENFTFYLQEKEDSYYVEKMEHTIPADYMK